MGVGGGAVGATGISLNVLNPSSVSTLDWVVACLSGVELIFTGSLIFKLIDGLSCAGLEKMLLVISLNDGLFCLKKP